PITGSTGGGGGGGSPSINVFSITNVNWSGNYITIAWTGVNEPSGVHYSLDVDAAANSWGPLDTTYTTITSPFTFYCSDLGLTLDKGGGWETTGFNLDLQMKDGTDATVSDRQRSTGQPATYSP